MADARLTDWPFVILRGSQNSTPGTRISSSRSLSQYDNKTFTFYVDFSTNFNRSGSHRCNTTPRERPCWSAARRKWKKKKQIHLRRGYGSSSGPCVRACVQSVEQSRQSAAVCLGFRLGRRGVRTARGEDDVGWGRRGMRRGGSDIDSTRGQRIRSPLNFYQIITIFYQHDTFKVAQLL